MTVSSQMTRHTTRLIRQPVAHAALLQGAALVTAAVRPTLGPLGHVVAAGGTLGVGGPELLDSGGLIARRIVQTADPKTDMGAMLMRELLCKLHDTVGDGTATAAVVADHVLRAGIAAIAAGCNPVRLRHWLEQGAAIIREQLSADCVAVSNVEMLIGVADSVCHDRELATHLGRSMALVGAYGSIDVRRGYGMQPAVDIIPGTYWPSGAASPHFVQTDPDQRAELEHPAILITDLAIEQPQDLLPALESALMAGHRAVVIVAGSLSSEVLGFLVANDQQRKFRTIAVKPPGELHHRTAALEDLAILTGGRAILRVAGETLRSVTQADLGFAQQAYIDCDYFGVIGGSGDPDLRELHCAALKRQFLIGDFNVREQLLPRLRHFVDCSVTLHMGGGTERHMTDRVALATQTIRVMRGALRSGVLPGGGTALLACRSALSGWAAQRHHENEIEQRIAARVLSAALEQPFRAIMSNAGLDPSETLAACSAPFVGIDVRSGNQVSVLEAGIIDSAEVTLHTIQAAVMSAAQWLTVDVLVQHV
jgi:chaperonin GroEL